MGRIKGKAIGAGIFGLIVGALLVWCFINVGWYYWNNDVGEGEHKFSTETVLGLSEGEFTESGSGNSTTNKIGLLVRICASS